MAGKSIAVLGAGLIGNLVAQAAKGMGASKVLITDVSDWRLDKVKEVGGAETTFCQIEFENGFKVSYSGTMRAIGLETGYQCNWNLQTDRATVKWEYDGELELAVSPGLPCKLTQQFDFPGFDRFGVLAEMKKALAGQPSNLPTVQDHVKSLAMSFAVLESAKENKRVYLADPKPFVRSIFRFHPIWRFYFERSMWPS